MIRNSAHKSGSAGQIVNDITLADYIKRKQDKLSFNDWWSKNHHNFLISGIAARKIWNAAQENVE